MPARADAVVVIDASEHGPRSARSPRQALGSGRKRGGRFLAPPRENGERRGFGALSDDERRTKDLVCCIGGVRCNLLGCLSLYRRARGERIASRGRFDE